jgi:uncharacterized protein (TIGR03000 family)
LKPFQHAAAIGVAALALLLATSDTSHAQAAPSNSATIDLSVPADAKVWFDDSPTVQAGPERRFQSPALTPGKTYEYVVTAQWRGPDGTDVVRKQPVTVRANETSNVEFVPRTMVRYYEAAPVYAPSYYPMQSYNWGSRRSFGGYYRVGNVIINGRRWGDIGYRYSHADLIRW